MGFKIFRRGSEGTPNYNSTFSTCHSNGDFTEDGVDKNKEEKEPIEYQQIDRKILQLSVKHYCLGF